MRRCPHDYPSIGCPVCYGCPVCPPDEPPTTGGEKRKSKPMANPQKLKALEADLDFRLRNIGERKGHELHFMINWGISEKGFFYVYPGGQDCRVTAEIRDKETLGWCHIAEGVSTLSKKDKFDKRLGRLIAKSRALAGLLKYEYWCS